MKKIFLSMTILMTSIWQSIGQTIIPTETSEVCVGVTITFTVTITANSITNVSAQAINVAPIVWAQPYNVSSSGGVITFNFDGRFSDANNKQTFRVAYVNSSGNPDTKDFAFTKIKSLFYSATCAIISPNQGSITALPCETANHTISFNNIQYGTLSNRTRFATGL